MSGVGNRLRLLTLNCWGLKYVAKHRKERIAAIANILAASDYDIVALQELWVFSDYEYVRSLVISCLPYSKFFYSGALGAGLVLFSRYPILAATVHPYSLNGTPIDVLAGDWFVGKAAASILISHPVLGSVQVYNTHLYAKGGDEGPDHHKAHRLVNAWEFAKLARQAAEMGHYVIGAGDFNSIPTAPPMSIIREHASLKDAWTESHAAAHLHSLDSTPSPSDAVQAFGVTADSPMNSYTAGKPLEPSARRFQGKRLDYIFYRQPSGPPTGRSVPLLECIDSKVVFTERVPGHSFSFSDHFGLEATFDISLPEASTNTSDESHASATGAPSSASNPSSRSSLSTDIITTTLQSLAARYRFAQSQARLHLAIFAASLVPLAIAIVGSAWLPRAWINPIFMILVIFLAWLSTTMLYVGFVFGRWELNALTNIIEELELYRDNLEEQRGTSPNLRRTIH